MSASGATRVGRCPLLRRYQGHSGHCRSPYGRRASVFVDGRSRRRAAAAVSAAALDPWRQLIDDLPMRKVRVILCGRDLSSRDLESIRPEIESFGAIEATSDDTRDLIAREWPHLVPRLLP